MNKVILLRLQLRFHGLEVVALGNEGNVTGSLTCTEDDEGRTMIKVALGHSMKFVRNDVTIIYSNDAGISFDTETEVTVYVRHTAAFAIHCIHAQVLKIHSIGLPVAIVRLYHKFLHLACGLDAMAGNHFTILIGNCFLVTRSVLHFVPTDTVTVEVFCVLLLAKALTVHYQFHFIAIGKGDE
jgi:hypothetical protein